MWLEFEVSYDHITPELCGGCKHYARFYGGLEKTGPACMSAKSLENHLKQTGRCCPLVHLSPNNDLARELFGMVINERLAPMLDGYRILIERSGTIHPLKMLRSWRRVIDLMQSKTVTDLMSGGHQTQGKPGSTGGRTSSTAIPQAPPNLRDPNAERPTGPERPLSLNIRAAGDNRP